MADYKVLEVVSKRDLKRFVKFPDQLYKDCPQYVPALHSDQIHSLTKVSTLKYCTRKMWLVVDAQNKVVGRICGIINPRYNEYYNRKRARFGWFDVVNDLEVARLLLGTAEKWAVDNGMDEIHGPLYYNTLGKQGMLVEGFENIPPFNCIYNFPYYKDLVEQLGYEKELDWIQYKMKADQGAPDRVRAIASRLQERYHLVEGNLDKLKKDKELVRGFFRMYSEGFAGTVQNFIPFTDEEIDEEAAMTVGMLDKKLSSILFDEDNQVAAFGIAVPSMSKALQKAKGSLFPFGWWHILKAMRNYENIDMILTGASPKWQNTGVSSVFHCLMADKFKAAGSAWAVANPQIESNSAINVWSRYDFHELYMRRRCYLKKIK